MTNTVKQLNNDYLTLPEHLWDVYRSADKNSPLFHENGVDITASEREEIIQAWKFSQVHNEVASWNDPACDWCGSPVCVCEMDITATFCLPPE